MSYVVGLTGGIGSGKSAAAALFAELGAAVVDTDVIARELTAPDGAAMPAIAREFGDALVGPDGALDRGAMRRLAFEQPEVRKRLEAILHPMIREVAQRRCREARAPYVVLVVPLLVESGGWRDRIRRVLVVDVAQSTQIRRVMARSGLSEAEVRAILAAQASREERLAAADDVIDNEGSLEALRRAVRALHGRYLAEASRSAGRADLRQPNGARRAR
ncbi:MAG: dephospho-CoA kinase [Rhodocyclaceae bacterium]